MGAIDIASKKYLADPARFADAFNYAVYGGEQVVNPRDLVPLDSSEAVAMEVRGRFKAGEWKRDLLKLWHAMRDNHAVYVVLGVEPQTKVNYAMPVRAMLYDALNLMSQVEETKRRHRRNRREGAEDGRRPSSAEFLSGFYKDDVLLPVVTLVVHFGPEEWDGPLSVHEMLKTDDEQLLRFVPNYRINLIAPARMGESDFQKFATGLGQVLEYVKYSRNKEELVQHVGTKDRFRSVDYESASLINLLTNSGLSLEAREERVDMCTAIEELREECRAEVLARSLRHLMANLPATAERAMDLLGVTPEERPAVVALLEQGV